MSESTENLVNCLSASSTETKRNNQRRQTVPALSYDYLINTTLSSFSMPLLIDSMNTFYQRVKIMEDEIMLPSTLKDMSVQELISDGAVQPDNWYEIYEFIRHIRNQLQCTHPFANDNNDSDEEQSKYLNDDNHNDSTEKQEYSNDNDDEGIMISNDNHSRDSSPSSTISSSESEQSLTLSTGRFCDTIKNQLKYHYFSLFQSFENLTSMTNRVIDKYRAESHF